MQTERGFVLHTPIGNWDSSLSITDSIALTTSRDIIEGLHQDNEIQGAVLTIGYSGWSAGQLEQEIAQNSWLTVPADPNYSVRHPARRTAMPPRRQLGDPPRKLCRSDGSCLILPHPPAAAALPSTRRTRIGAAQGDCRIRIAHPIATITGNSNDEKFARIAALIQEWQPET